MEVYLHRETSDAVRSLFSLYDAALRAAESISYNAENLSTKRAQEKYPQIAAEFRAQRLNVVSVIRAAADAAMKRAQKKIAAELTIGEAAEDFKLLALPVTLTGKELAMLIDRNIGNKLFLRAVDQYAKEHDIPEADFAEAKSRSIAADFAVDYEKTARQLAEYLETRIPPESIINAPEACARYERELKSIEESGLLKRLDDAV